tara:strand:- start:198 stop:380 length:183 start_codon:yes stop_codon:yes gene_type:complete
MKYLLSACSTGDDWAHDTATWVPLFGFGFVETGAAYRYIGIAIISILLDLSFVAGLSVTL